MTAAKLTILLPAHLYTIIRQEIGLKSDFASVSWDLIAMKSQLSTDEVRGNCDEVPADGDEVPGNWNIGEEKC